MAAGHNLGREKYARKRQKEIKIKEKGLIKIGLSISKNTYTRTYTKIGNIN